jgi:hypothetical protein
MDDPHSRAAAFCDRFGIRVPILLAPMAGACLLSSSTAVMRAGGFGACAALLMRGRNLLPSLQSECGVRRRRCCARPLLIGVSLLGQSQTWCSSFSSVRSGRKYIIAGNAIMTRASGL